MEYELVKVFICAICGTLIALMLGCGITNGSVTMGTTGFLQTVKQRSMLGVGQSQMNTMQHTPHSTSEKQRLEDQIRRY